MSTRDKSRCLVRETRIVVNDWCGRWKIGLAILCIWTAIHPRGGVVVIGEDERLT